MRHFGVVFFMACEACSSKDRSAARAEPPVASGTLDATPPPVAVVDAGPPPNAARATTRVVYCKSSDGKYRVDLSLHGLDPHPRTAQVLIDGREPGTGGPTGVVFGRGPHLPARSRASRATTRRTSNAGCYVANTLFPKPVWAAKHLNVGSTATSLIRRALPHAAKGSLVDRVAALSTIDVALSSVHDSDPRFAETMATLRDLTTSMANATFPILREIAWLLEREMPPS
jgi:hypothetical protein